MAGVNEKLLVEENKEDDDSSSSSSSSSDDEDEGENEAQGVLPVAAQPTTDAVRISAVSRWKRAGRAVRAHVLVRKIFSDMASAERKRYVLKLFMVSVLLNVLDTESKAIAFHSTSVGKYSVDGKPYKFSYSLFVALLVFIVKLCLGPMKRCLHKMEKKDGHSHHAPKKNKPINEAKEKQKKELKDAKKECKKEGWFVAARAVMNRHGQSVVTFVMPWVLLIAFTLCEMMSVTLANYALNVTPTSIFIVLRCSKMGIVAVISRILLGSKLRKEQWVALFLMVIALLIATVAEDKGGKGGGVSWQGPIVLIISECFYSIMLILQQIAVTEYWPDPMLLMSASAALGIPMTITSMIAGHKIMSPLPPHHPVSDPEDVLIMCSNSAVLTSALFGHLFFRVSLDAYHIMSAKHLPALERAMTDVVKLCIMWILGKSCWFIGAYFYASDWPKGGGLLAILGEPWHPHSWMMIPGLILISYAMLMYKFKVFVPIKFVKDKNGKMGMVFQEATMTKEEKQQDMTDVGLDDPFYSAAFTNRKIRSNLKHTLGNVLTKHREQTKTVFQTQDPKNKWQKVALAAHSTTKDQL